MRIFSKIDELQAALVENKHNQSLALVPTMGYLHAGHISLIGLAKKAADLCIVSIFVNPLQFNNKHDLAHYPKDPERDKKMLAEAGVDFLFMPDAQQIYGENFQSKVSVGELSKKWEGEFRPGHFEGVATVVNILFNIINPNYAVFGEKDFQQLRVIEQMVEDLKLGIKIIRAINIREKDGLAMSSRNVRLTSEARSAALSLSKGLLSARQIFINGERDSNKLKQIVAKEIAAYSQIKIDYIALVDQTTLNEVSSADTNSRLLLAATVGEVRLIDNIGF